MTAKIKTETMLVLVDQWKSSQSTQKQFCADHDLKASTFAYWIAKHKRAGSNSEPAGGFVGVDVSGPSGSDPVRITYPNGVVVSCPADLPLISQLIRLA